jgi:hypothetical protein
LLCSAPPQAERPERWTGGRAGGSAPEQAAAQITKADAEPVARHLETLALLREATLDGTGRYARAVKVA